MPELLRTNGEIDFSKMFMAVAVAVVFIMQSWHTMQMDTLSKTIVPRTEVEQTYVPHKEITQGQDTLENQIVLLTKAIEGLAAHTEYDYEQQEKEIQGLKHDNAR